MHEEEEELLKKKLQQVHDSGVALFLEGKRMSPQEIARRCVQEDSNYMADYVCDEQGILKELRYDKISGWK